MTPKAEITPVQFYTILFLSRIFALVTYVMSLRTQLSSTDRVIMTLFTGVFLVLTAIPTAIFIRQDNTQSVIMRAGKLSHVFSRIICIFYLVEAVYFGVITSVRFGIFTGSVMFPDTNIVFFIFMMLAFSAFTAFKGIEAVGRSSFVILFPVLFSLLFVFATQSEDFDLLNLTPAFTSGTKDILSTALFSASRTGELAFVTLMPPFVRKQKSRHIFMFIFAITAVMFISELVMSAVLGNYGSTQLFGMYSLSVLADLGFIERLDALFTCVWLLCAGVKISITLFLCSSILSAFTGRNRRVLYIAVSAVLIFAGSLPLAGNLISLTWLINAPVTQILYLTGVVVIPVTVMIWEGVKKREKA